MKLLEALGYKQNAEDKEKHTQDEKEKHFEYGKERTERVRISHFVLNQTNVNLFVIENFCLCMRLYKRPVTICPTVRNHIKYTLFYVYRSHSMSKD